MPPSPRDPVDSIRPSLRAVAKLAGVSAMTVSRVLRESRGVSALVRARVEKAVRDVGYRPDPEVAKLMHHLRLRRKPAFQASICALTTVALAPSRYAYAREIIAGAQRKAETRGYGFTTISIANPASARSLQRVLRSRGVEGVLLLPMAAPAALTGLLEWSDFSAVATTSSVLAPEFHTVMPHHFKNTQMLCRRLRELGYRRPGLVLPEEHLERVYHALNAAMAWDGIFHDGGFVPPFIYRGPRPKELRTWFRREAPDAIVGHSEVACRELAQALALKIPGPIGLASANTTADSLIAGMDERPHEIGASAVDLLTGMIQRGEKGVPAVPTATLLRGAWVAGRSCAAHAGRGAPRGRATGPLLYREG